MSHIDEFDRMLKYFRRRMEELELLARALISGALEYPSPGDASHKARTLSDGIIEPLVSFYEEGDHLIIAVNLPGASSDTIEVRLYEDRLEIRAALNEAIVRRALGTLYWSREVREYRGTFTLPARVDPSTAIKELRGGVLIIRARKIQQ